MSKVLSALSIVALDNRCPRALTFQNWCLDMEDVLRYTQEFAILNTLNHKNIIKLHEVSCTPLALSSISTNYIYTIQTFNENSTRAPSSSAFVPCLFCKSQS
jgi:predicted transglutaminase-like protease